MNYRKITRFARSTTARLALSYLAIIMVLSIGFSFVLYNVSVRELGRQEPPPRSLSDHGDFKPGPMYHSFFEHRIDEGRHVLISRLLLLNVVVLLGGALLSYYLARRTLEPIEEAMDAQIQFVTDASHELRTPLTAILASNEVALRDPKLKLPKAKAVITSNMEEAAKLRDLAEGLLSLAAVSNANRAHVAVSLQEVAGDAINQVIAVAQAKKVTIDDQVPNVLVKGDRQSLSQVLTVLLDNAIKYSPPMSTVYLTGRANRNHGFIEVRDKGKGISKDDIPRIFDRFYRSDESRTTDDSSGYGIGLSIAKKIIEQHGGSIQASSQLGKGSTLTVSIPLVRS